MAQDASANLPEDAFSKIAPEAGLLFGAGRAILMQLAHPQIGVAIDKHSDFANNPLSRLIHTLGYIYALSNGTSEHQRIMINYVNAAHRNVRGPKDQVGQTPAYSALDPKLQLWVAATLFDSARVIGAQILPGHIEHDEGLYQRYAQLGEALQMPSKLWPATLRDFDDYLNQTQRSLQVTDRTRALANELFAGRNAPWWIRAGLPLMRDVTIAQLPTSLREQFGFVLSPKVRRRNDMVIGIVRGATSVLPRWVRHAPMRLMLRRIEKMGQS